MRTPLNDEDNESRESEGRNEQIGKLFESIKLGRESDNALYITMDGFGTACNVTGDGAIAMIVNRFALLNKNIYSSYGINELPLVCIRVILASIILAI